jgi:hypothetical protein
MGRHPALSRWIGNAIKNDAELRGVRLEFLGEDAYPVLRIRYQWRALRVAGEGRNQNTELHRVNVFSEKFRANTA